MKSIQFLVYNEKSPICTIISKVFYSHLFCILVIKKNQTNSGPAGATADELQQPGPEDPPPEPEEGMGWRQQGREQGQDREEVDEEAPQGPPPKQLVTS